MSSSEPSSFLTSLGQRFPDDGAVSSLCLEASGCVEKRLWHQVRRGRNILIFWDHLLGYGVVFGAMLLLEAFI